MYWKRITKFAIENPLSTNTKRNLSNNILIIKHMKALGYLGAFFGGAIAGAALGLLLAPEKGEDTRTKISDTVSDFCKKHNLKLSRKDVEDLVDDIKDAATED